MLIYTICGLCSGVAGVVMVARLRTGSPIVGEGFEMDAICAVAIGGTSMLGGSGGLTKSAIGAVVLSVISIGLNIMGVSSSMQKVIKGFLILAVVAVDMMKHRIKKSNNPRP
jgi:ribose transport system permease protein